MAKRSSTRREEYAEATRSAIVESARRLFADQGYFATTVEQIATAARVAPATVYAVTGGKRGLIHLLVDAWSQAPIVAETLDRQASMTDPDEILAHAAGAVRTMREEFGDIMRVALVTAPHDPAVADDLHLATTRYRNAIAALAERLHDVGGLHPDLSVAAATDVLWFYLGYTGFTTLVHDNGWTYADAERWLITQATFALRNPPPPPRPSPGPGST
jgi:AcrR family transcriptional regulator